MKWDYAQVTSQSESIMTIVDYQGTSSATIANLSGNSAETLQLESIGQAIRSIVGESKKIVIRSAKIRINASDANLNNYKFFPVIVQGDITVATTESASDFPETCLEDAITGDFNYKFIGAKHGYCLKIIDPAMAVRQIEVDVTKIIRRYTAKFINSRIYDSQNMELILVIVVFGPDNGNSLSLKSEVIIDYDTVADQGL